VEKVLNRKDVFFFSEVTNGIKEERQINLCKPVPKGQIKHIFYRIYSN